MHEDDMFKFLESDSSPYGMLMYDGYAMEDKEMSAILPDISSPDFLKMP